VSAIAHRVAEISGGSLHERIPEPDSSDEIAELAQTMNGMLDRLESSDQRRRRFVSDASHELRSPVATIRSVTEVAARRPDQADWPDVADDVLAETRRLEDLVADLLQLARADEGRVVTEGAEVDLDDLVLAEIGRPRSVPIDGGAVGAARVQGRPDELQRMVRHLVDNAARHAATQVRVELGSDGPQARLTVDDDGPGIAPADRALIFERFVRLDQARTRDRGGAGLGLSVAAAVATAHGGTIEVGESSLGGARFTVRLPLAQR
jgi:signal transduction histidine kinase